MPGIKKLGAAIALAVDQLSRGVIVIGALAVVIMIVTMLSDAIARQVIGAIPGAFETSKVLMVAIAYLPVAYVQKQRRHVAVDLLVRRWSRKAQAVHNGIVSLAGFGFFGLVTWLTLREAWASTANREFWMGMMDYPVWPFRWFLSIGMGLLTVQLLRTAIEEFGKARRRE